MKNVPEIAPEIRGLLEEIVADPRSSIRLVPKRALGKWFDSGEAIRPREASRTRAEQHLIEAHREELAALLCEASRIAYWKAPVFAHRPIGSDGLPYDPTQTEPSWQKRVKRSLGSTPSESENLELLEQCLGGISGRKGLELALASLALSPSDRTRCYVSLNIPWNRPRTAIARLRRLALCAQPATLRPNILQFLGARLCSVDRNQEARETYRRSYELDPNLPSARAYAFNLACFLGESASAVYEAAELGKLVPCDDRGLLEVKKVIHEWAKTRTPGDRKKARNIAAAIVDDITDSAQILCQAYEL